MALLESLSLPLGQIMPSFELLDTEGTKNDSNDLMGRVGLLVAFTCNHCPYALAIWPRLIRLSLHAAELGVQTVAINPNIHPDYPDDAPDKMREKVKQWGIPFPYLIDEDQAIAKQFAAQCTPDLYLLNAQHQLVYHGRLDDNWKNPDLVTRHELRAAIESLADNEPIADIQHPSMGCSIKWKNQ